jgi:AraC-like DNA-binding protein
LFLDVSADRAFEPLAKAPLFCSMNVQHREDLVRLFERLEVRCLAAGRPAPRYLTGPAAYAPPRGEERWTARPYFVKAALLELLAQLLEDARASEPDAGRPLPKGLAAAMEFMGLHYGNPDLTLDDVARAAYLSVDHFGRLFRQHTGMTPMRYLRLTRIDQSRFLLKRTGLRVEEVAREVGFPDPFHFSKVFRHVIGMSPTQYREGKPG